jgi:hypothetical protein
MKMFSDSFLMVRIGNRGSSLSNYLATPVFLDEYTVTGQLRQTIAVPTTQRGNQVGLLM